jgi:hypothetical protein
MRFEASHRPVAGTVHEQQHVLAQAEGRQQMVRQDAMNRVTVARRMPGLSRGRGPGCRRQDSVHAPYAYRIHKQNA